MDEIKIISFVTNMHELIFQGNEGGKEKCRNYDDNCNKNTINSFFLSLIQPRKTQFFHGCRREWAASADDIEYDLTLMG